jgi:hypothetical protein
MQGCIAAALCPGFSRTKRTQGVMIDVDHLDEPLRP